MQINVTNSRFEPMLRAAILVSAAISAFLVSDPVSATTITASFNFNNMCTGICGSGVTTSQNATSATISTYATNVLKAAGFSTASVTVSGGLGQQGASAWTADGHTVGPKSNGVVTDLTLGNTDYNTTTNKTVQDTAAATAKDGFLINCNGDFPGYCGNVTSDDIFFKFNNLVMNGKQFQIASLQFDLEIFPDITCPQVSSSCSSPGSGNWPDFELWTGDNGTGTELHNPWYGVVPGTGGTYLDSSTMPNGETAPQLLSNSGLISVNASKLTTLDFKDWPATIGIDNLKINFVPEPGTLVLFGFGVVGLMAAARRYRWLRANPSTA